MPPTPSKKRQADLRAVPSYGIAESAHYLGICESTLRSWLYGRPYPTRSGTVKRTTAIIHPADPRNGILSFYNLVEAHVLLFHRQVYGIRLPAVRAAVEHVRKTLGLKRPLIHQVFYTDGKDLFINELEKDVIIDASKRGPIGDLADSKSLRSTDRMGQGRFRSQAAPRQGKSDEWASHRH
jgi:hypothetical protein